MTTTIAILCSDLHLSLTAPVARTAEPDWLAAQGRVLKQVRLLQELAFDVPVIYAGDVFDRWNVSPELINWVIDNLPHGYAIPGQHDLPLHQYEDVNRSAYWTLVKAGVIEDLEYGKPIVVNDRLVLYGFPWGKKILSLADPIKGKLNVAVVHAYCWKAGYCYPGASQSVGVAEMSKMLSGYDAATFGDNHLYWMK